MTIDCLDRELKPSTLWSGTKNKRVGAEGGLLGQEPPERPRETNAVFLFFQAKLTYVRTRLGGVECPVKNEPLLLHKNNGFVNPDPAPLSLSPVFSCLCLGPLTFLSQGVTPSSIVPPHRTRDNERYGFSSRSRAPFPPFFFFLFAGVPLPPSSSAAAASGRTGSSLKPPALVPFSLRVSCSCLFFWWGRVLFWGAR